MFSDVGNIYAPQNGLLREAEVTDTRQQMQRREPLFFKKRKNQRKHDDQSESEFSLPAQEDNEIPIDTIYEFLANIVQSGPRDDKDTDPQSQTSMPSLFDTLAENKLLQIRRRYEAARAAHAYAHAAHTAQNSRVHHIDSSNKTCLGLSSISNKQLYSLIKDIDDLRRHGVTTLMIRRHKSFLESLLECVETEKQRLKDTKAEAL